MCNIIYPIQVFVPKPFSSNNSPVVNLFKLSLELSSCTLSFAHTIAQDRVHELNSKLSLNRFTTGELLDEKGLGTKTWIG
jgi:hypothetical protein